MSAPAPPLYLYIDGSGHADYMPPVEKGDTQYYCLTGLIVDAGQRAAIERRCDEIVGRFFPDQEPRTVELKASWISARVNQKRPWDRLPGPRHAEVFEEIEEILLDVKPVLFGQVLHKETYRQGIHASRPERPATNALRFLLTRVCHHLDRGTRVCAPTLDSDSREIQEAQLRLEASVRADGDKIMGASRPPMSVTRFEKLLPFQHLASSQSRCLQATDYVVHQLWQAAEHGKAQRLRKLDPLWDRFRTDREPWLAFVPSSVEELVKR